MTIIKHRFVLVFTIIASLYVLGRQSDKYFGWTNEKNIKPDHALTIHTDGAGYYAYLPKWFIYKDSKGFDFLKKITDDYENPHFLSGIRLDKDYPNGMDKYYVGTAILSSPFFLINHGLNLLFYGEGDGYSKSYQLTVALNAMFFYFIGILGFIKVLRFFNLNNLVVSASVLMMTFGTNLNFYTVYFPSFSHVFSFCLIAWFFYFSLLFGSNSKKRHLIILAFLLGGIFLVRPTNSIVLVLLPFCFISLKSFLYEVKRIVSHSKLIFLGSVLIFLFFISIQLFINYFQLGKFTFNTYTEESFSFLLNPKWKEVLFSYKKGYFIYAPIMLLSILGGYFLFKTNRFLFYGWLLLNLILLYVTSSWWCWWYGGGLGMRPFVDFLPILFLPISLMMSSLKRGYALLILVVSFFCSYLYQVYQIQYNKNILHYDGVTKEQFSSVFLKTDDRFSWMLHFEEQFIDSNYLKIESKYLSDLDDWTESAKLDKELVLTFETSDPMYLLKMKKSGKNKGLAFRFKGEMMLTMPQSNPSFEVTFYKAGEEIKKQFQYIGNRINNLNQWESFEKDFIPEIKENDIDSIQVRLTKGYPLTYIKNVEVQQFLER
jgi:hypothetical protein